MIKRIYGNKYFRRSLLVLFDIFTVIVSYAIATFFLNLQVDIMSKVFIDTAVVASTVYITMFLASKVYRSITKYTGAKEYTHYLLLVLTCIIIISLITAISKFPMLGIRINILAGCFVLGFMVVSRVTCRSILLWIEENKHKKSKSERILIIGAGSTGLQAVRDILPRLDIKYKVVGIIDDRVSKKNSLIYGINIIGGRERIAEICEKEKVDVILFTIANISKKEKTEILNICSKTKARVKVIPNMKELLQSDRPLNINTFRDVQIEDLLGREPIKLEADEIKENIKGKVVLVTGGGGSIGSELCRQIASFGAKELLMLDIYENTLYETELEIRRAYPELNVTAIVASVRDNKRIEEIMELYHPDIVFHAAAHKHVPLMETSPIEAVKNNVFGTLNVAKAASKYKVKKFVLVSTDKAVNPTSIMGATKRICEMIIQMQNAKSKTNYVAVRFGNVLGSHGSVIPIFKKQIAEGGPVTVTHKDITRYFMTIPEAVGLILQATTFAEGGEIFVLDMGEPVKIYDLAEKMIMLSGLEPNVDIPIKVTGLRPGEKLYEELLISEEGLSHTVHDKIMVTKIMDFDEKEIEEDLELLKQVVMSKDASNKQKVKEIIKKIVPSFIDKSTDNNEQNNSSDSDTISYVVTVNKKTHKKEIKNIANKG